MDGIRALIIDDDPALARFVSYSLQHASFPFETDISETLHDAVEKATHPGTYDVIILDIGLPNSVTIEDTVASIRAAFPDVAVVIMTGGDYLTKAKQFIKDGIIQDYVRKGDVGPEGIAVACELAMSLKERERDYARLRSFYDLTKRQAGILKQRLA